MSVEDPITRDDKPKPAERPPRRGEGARDGENKGATPSRRDHRDQLDNLAEALLEHETLDEPDANRAAGLPVRVAEDGDKPEPVASTDSGQNQAGRGPPKRSAHDDL